MEEQGQAPGRTVNGRLNIQAARARCEAATPKPWAVTDRNAAGDRYVGPVDEYVAIVVRSAVNDLPTEANADFIAHARSDLPAALEALEEAQGKLLAVKGRLLEIVEECEEIGEDPSYLFSMIEAIDPKALDLPHSRGDALLGESE